MVAAPFLQLSVVIVTLHAAGHWAVWIWVRTGLETKFPRSFTYDFCTHLSHTFFCRKFSIYNEGGSKSDKQAGPSDCRVSLASAAKCHCQRQCINLYSASQTPTPNLLAALVPCEKEDKNVFSRRLKAASVKSADCKRRRDRRPPPFINATLAISGN